MCFFGRIVPARVFEADCAMNAAGLKALAGAVSEEELAAAMERLLLPFGTVKSIQMVRNESGQEYLCFAEFHERGLHAEVIKQFGGASFGGGMVFRIPFKR